MRDAEDSTEGPGTSDLMPDPGDSDLVDGLDPEDVADPENPNLFAAGDVPEGTDLMWAPSEVGVRCFLSFASGSSTS